MSSLQEGLDEFRDREQFRPPTSSLQDDLNDVRAGTFSKSCERDPLEEFRLEALANVGPMRIQELSELTE